MTSDASSKKWLCKPSLILAYWLQELLTDWRIDFRPRAIGTFYPPLFFYLQFTLVITIRLININLWNWKINSSLLSFQPDFSRKNRSPYNQVQNCTVFFLNKIFVTLIFRKARSVKNLHSHAISLLEYAECTAIAVIKLSVENRRNWTSTKSEIYQNFWSITINLLKYSGNFYSC